MQIRIFRLNPDGPVGLEERSFLVSLLRLPPLSVDETQFVDVRRSIESARELIDFMAGLGSTTFDLLVVPPSFPDDFVLELANFRTVPLTRPRAPRVVKNGRVVVE